MRSRARSYSRRCRVALLAVPLALLATGLAAPVGAAAPTRGTAPAGVTAAYPTDGQGRVTFRQTGAPYLNPDLPVAKRVEDLMGRMTLEEKVGQMTMAERGAVTDDPTQVTALMLGAVLSGGGSVPADNTPAGWADMVDMFQEHALQTRLQIPILYGVDSVHGHGNLNGATVFPHNIGLGSTGDPKLIERIEHVVAEETRATGPQWSFAPCVCVARDTRWGRTYESFSEDPRLVTRLSRGIRGFQGDNAGDLRDNDRVLATAKHYAGDGDTEFDTAAGDYTIDQGVTITSREDFARIDLAPFVAAVRQPQDGHRDAVLLQRGLDRGRDRQPAQDARAPRADHRCTEEPDRVRRVRDLRLGGHPPDPRRLGDPGADRCERRHRHVHGAVLQPGRSRPHSSTR